MFHRPQHDPPGPIQRRQLASGEQAKPRQVCVWTVATKSVKVPPAAWNAVYLQGSILTASAVCPCERAMPIMHTAERAVTVRPQHSERDCECPPPLHAVHEKKATAGPSAGRKQEPRAPYYIRYYTRLYTISNRKIVNRAHLPGASRLRRRGCAAVPGGVPSLQGTAPAGRP